MLPKILLSQAMNIDNRCFLQLSLMILHIAPVWDWTHQSSFETLLLAKFKE